MLSKFTLKTKLLGLCVLLSVVSLAVGLTGYLSLKNVSGEYGWIAKKTMPKIASLDKMYQSYLGIRIHLRTVGLVGITPSQTAEAVKNAQDFIAAYEREDKIYADLGFAEGQKELYEKLNDAWLDFKKTGGEVFSLQKSGTPADHERLNQIFFNDCPDKAKKYNAAIEALSIFHDKLASDKVASAELINTNANTTILLTILVGTLFGLGFGYMFANSVAKSLNKISENMSDAAEQTSSGGTQLASASAQLSSGATEAAASLEETVASLEELSSMVKMNTDNAQQANMLSKSSREAAEKGASEIEKLISSMTEIANGSKKIEEIIHVIDDIAFQTNLLALNAAVEAARAGEQGKGFAVVAEAVRTLAQKSADAAKDINSLIKENVVKSEQGAKVAGESEAVLKNILVAVKKVADLNGEIAAGSQEQSTGLEQISKAMNQLDQATQGNAASSEEVAASSEQMSDQAGGLARMVVELKQIVHGGHAEQASHSTPSYARSSASPKPRSHKPGSSKPSLRLAKNTASQSIPFDDDGDPSRKVGDVSGF